MYKMGIYILNLTLLSLYILHARMDPIINNEDSSCYKPNAPECNLFGNYNCGVCECDELHAGDHCECVLAYGPINPNGCKQPGSDIDCSGRGACICGFCECNKRENPNEVIHGTFCECDNFSCLRHTGQICGGHGKCSCGQCICERSWTGDDCGCNNNTDTCISSP